MSEDFSWIEEAIDSILLDLSDRRGLKQEYERVDEEVREEMRQTWINTVKQSYLLKD